MEKWLVLVLAGVGGFKAITMFSCFLRTSVRFGMDMSATKSERQYKSLL
jgi:hypothetical protein